MIGSRYIGSIISNASNAQVLELTLETNRQCIGCVLSYVKLEQNYVKLCQIRRNQGNQSTHVSPHCHVTWPISSNKLDNSKHTRLLSSDSNIIIVANSLLSPLLNNSSTRSELIHKPSSTSAKQHHPYFL